MSFSNNFPTTNPTLELDFANVNALDPRITFTRSSIATVTNSLGLIQTVGANVPRFDYDPVTLAAKGLLIEEQRTNLLTYSEQFDNAAWVKDGAGTTVTANAVAAPDGTLTADLATFTAGAGKRVRQDVAVTSGQTYTFSIYARSVTGSVNARLFIGSVAVSGASQEVFALSTTWTRITFSPTFTASGTAQFRFDTNDLDGSFYVWGAQLEAGSFATSYIPTVASQVTRSADVASMTGTAFSSWYSAGQGTYVIQASSQQTGGVLQSFFQDGNITLGTNGVGNLSVYNGNTYSGLATVVSGINATTFTAAVAYTSGTGASGFSVNGAAASSFTNPGLAPQASFGIGTAVTGGGSGARGINGYVRKLAFYPVRLVNSQLQALTL